MKKSLLAVFISSTFLLVACNDTELKHKLQQAEQQISQLKNELEKTQQNLTALQQTEKSVGLNVEIYPFFEKSETIQFSEEEQKQQEAEVGVARETSHLYYFVSLAKTGETWLDTLIARQALLKLQNNEEEKDPNTISGNEPTQLKDILEKYAQIDIAELQKLATLGIANTLETYYIGQRNHIATFSQFYYAYHGGAHGIYATDYLNIDLNKKRLIQFDEIIPKANQGKLKTLLWQIYEHRAQAQNNYQENTETFVNKEDFDISNNIYFTENGVVFVYPVYAIGSFAEGEIELALSWNDINPLLNPEYQRTKKDGFGLINAELIDY